jgi:NAD(P)-dependent dehydrogenase (short-subunit alcohol dehydrogenase family)
MDLGFDGRNVVVTGGTGALGQAVVHALLDEGAECFLPVHSADGMERISWYGHERAHAATGVDLADESAVTAYYGRLGGLWASVHCAGGFAMKPFNETGLADFERQQKINFTTCFLCCREAAAVIARTQGQGGRIVNVTARGALEPRQGAGMVAYTVSKAAVAALTVSLAEELSDSAVWVNAVAPSIMDTPSNREAMADADFSRWPTTEDVASTMLFLASPANRSTRGAIVPVYGRS